MQNRKRLRDASRETVMSVLDAEVEYHGVLPSRVKAIGLASGKFTLPVKPLVVDFGNIDADANR